MGADEETRRGIVEIFDETLGTSNGICAHNVDLRVAHCAGCAQAVADEVIDGILAAEVRALEGPVCFVHRTVEGRLCYRWDDRAALETYQDPLWGTCLDCGRHVHRETVQAPWKHFKCGYGDCRPCATLRTQNRD